jgi:hypothetical protein
MTIRKIKQEKRAFVKYKIPNHQYIKIIQVQTQNQKFSSSIWKKNERKKKINS